MELPPRYPASRPAPEPWCFDARVVDFLEHVRPLPWDVIDKPLWTPWHTRVANFVAGARNESNERHSGRQVKYGQNPMVASAKQIAGCQAELAVSEATNLRWSAAMALDDFGMPDIGGYIEVRHSPGHYSRLIVWPDDKPLLPYVFVTGDPPGLILRGWVFGCEAQEEQNWGELTQRSGRPCYIVTTDQLRPIQDLPHPAYLAILQEWGLDTGARLRF